MKKNERKMKLQDIDKKEIFKVPDRYFEELPGRIQDRIHKKQPEYQWMPVLNRAVKYAIPALAVLFVVLYFTIYDRAVPQDKSYEAILEEVSTDNIITYLEYQDITTEEIIENIDVSAIDFEINEDAELFNEEEMDEETIDAIIEEYNLDV